MMLNIILPKMNHPNKKQNETKEKKTRRTEQTNKITNLEFE